MTAEYILKASVKAISQGRRPHCFHAFIQSDEWSTCEDCNKAFRTSPDSHGWTPAYKWVGECSMLCLACAGEA